MNDVSGIVTLKKQGATAGKPSFLENVGATLQQIERAQIVAGLIETATTERPHEFASVFQTFRVDFPIAPREKIVCE
jgi:hypothetical protein